MRLNRAPYLLGRERQIEMSDAERLERIEHRVGDRGRGANRARLADALHAEWIRRRRRDRAAEHVFGNVARARDGVIHELAGQQLPVFVVDGPLEEDLADGMRDASLNLSFDDERI